MTCSTPSCERLPGRNGYCATCSRQMRKASTPKPAKKRVRISKTAEPERQKMYMAIRQLYLTVFPDCEVCADSGVKIPAEDIHHKAGKLGDLLCDVRYFLGVCRRCHTSLHEYPVDAIEAGWSILRTN